MDSSSILAAGVMPEFPRGEQEPASCRGVVGCDALDFGQGGDLKAHVLASKVAPILLAHPPPVGDLVKDPAQEKRPNTQHGGSQR